MLRHLHPAKEVIAFILVPAWVSSPRMDLKSQLNSFSLQNHPLSDPLITHGLHNYNDDAVMNRLHQLHFHNNPNNKVKIIFVPSYLKGEDGIFNMTYYNLLIGMDVTVFPSYYEPWGYTPLESVAFGVPTITTDLSGFGKWCESEGWGDDISSGVKVIHRTDNNYDEVVKDVAYNIINLISKSKIDLQVINDKSRNIAHMAQWENFIKFYMLAFDKAIDQSEKRNSVN